MKEYLTNPKYQIPARKKLRNNSTPAEIALWNIIKSKQIEGRKFRRQFGVGKYILDFYCSTERLAIELDGHDHFTEAGIQKDISRDNFLNLQDIKVVHIENKCVFENTDQVIQLIKDSFRNR